MTTADCVKVTWEIDDGSAGKSRPQYTLIPREEWDECESEEDRDMLIDEYVRCDFEQKIGWSVVGVES